MAIPNVFLRIKPTANRFLFVFLLFFTPLADAASDEMLTMRQALQLTLQQHPELPGYQALIQSTEGYTQQAAVGALPELSLQLEDAFGTDNLQGLDGAQTTLGISWLLEGDLLDKRVAAARQQKDRFITEQEVKRLDIAAETARKFVEALWLQEKSRLAQSGMIQAKAVLKAVEKRVSSGASPQADLLRALAIVERKQLAVLDRQNELKIAYLALAAQWGQEKPRFSQLAGQLAADEAPLAPDYYLKQLEANPNLRQFVNQSRITESQIALAQAEAKSRFRINAGVRRYEFNDSYAATLGFSVPFGGGERNAGRIAALRSEQGAYDLNAEALKLSLKVQLRGLIQSYSGSQQAQATLKKSVMPRLQQAVREAHTAYQSGAYSYQEWQGAQREWLDSQAELLDVQYHAQLKRIEIERITGVVLSN